MNALRSIVPPCAFSCIDEAAAACGVSKRTAERHVASGEWPSICIGRSVRVSVQRLEEWISRQEEQQSA
ncbi:MAG: helix-turn-helix domain-containing protein [Actinobacteria bacterium]|nr:helix-turn-helix domain-containing protein [Actinomycetota bacterium]